MKNTIVFPGSFDPWTYGHEAVLKDYLDINPTGKVNILISINPDKKSTFSLEERKILIEKTLPENLKKRVKVVTYSGAIADYVYENSYVGILKGARDSKDFDYEKELAFSSQTFFKNLKTIIIPQLNPYQTIISSSSLKAISMLSGDIASFASPLVREALRMKQSGKFIIGVTGGIASGKTTICKKLENISKNKNIKIHYINLDEITQEIHTRQDLPIFQEIRNEIKDKFGSEVLNNDGITNKKLLGDIVFSDRKKMEDLMEIILEPLVFFLRKKIDEIKNPGIILVEGAIIFERNLTYIFDENIIHIGIPKSEQEKRILLRDNLTKKQIEHRLKNQLSTKDRINGIKKAQALFKNQNRIFINIDGIFPNIEKIYEDLVGEYENRRKFIY